MALSLFHCASYCEETYRIHWARELCLFSYQGTLGVNYALVLALERCNSAVECRTRQSVKIQIPFAVVSNLGHVRFIHSAV